MTDTRYAARDISGKALTACSVVSIRQQDVESRNRKDQIMLDTYKMLDPKGFGGLFDSDYMIEKTKNDLIYIGHPSIPENDFLRRLDQLVDSAQDGHEDIRTRVADIVTTYDVDAKANMRAGR